MVDETAQWVPESRATEPGRRAGWRVAAAYRSRLNAVAFVVGIAQLIGWGSAALFVYENPGMLAFCGIAFALGVRHALDADHIAAIDNVSRSIVGRGERPVGVGLFFALGHCSVVAIAAAVVGSATGRLGAFLGDARESLAVYAMLIPIAVLLLIVPRNACSAWRLFRSLGRPACAEPASPQFAGITGRLLRPLLCAPLQSWHMFFVGILFAFGLETAVAVGLLTLGAARSAGDLSFAAVMVFPLLFTAGMTLVDAADGVLMERAYSWARKFPDRHRLYNAVVTALSAAVALVVGMIQLLSLIQYRFGADVLRWQLPRVLIDHFPLVGAAIIVAFAVVWILARLVGAVRTAP